MAAPDGGPALGDQLFVVYLLLLYFYFFFNWAINQIYKQFGICK